MKSLSSFIRTISSSGPSTAAMYFALFIFFAISVTDIFLPDLIKPGFLLNTSSLLTLLFLADLLYIKLKEKRESSAFLDGSGIISTSRHLESNKLRGLMLRPGKIFVLNAWIPNASELFLFFEHALDNKSTEIELTIIDQNSKFAAERGAELGMTANEVKEAVNHTMTDIRRFYLQLDPEKRQRFKLFICDYLPKVSMYANGSLALVGFCWPKKYSVETSYFYIDGIDGHFARTVFDYYHQLDRQDISCRLQPGS